MTEEFVKSPSLKAYEKIRGLPAGNLLFSKVVCHRAPYFKSINPRVKELRPNYMEATLRKRRAVTNHIGTVHAMAMCNLCEFVAGTLMEISRPATTRWIPSGMNARYLKKAETDLKAVCELKDIDWDTKGDVNCHVDVYDTNGEVVMYADVPIYLSPVK